MRSREVLFGFLFSLSTMVSAQTDTLYRPSIWEIYKQNNWLEGTNPIGLSFNRFRSYSMAEAGYSYHNGNLGNVSIPASANIYSVYSESFQTLNNISLYGKIGYTQYQNGEQNWNGMTGDHWQAVNLCDSINGKQRSEQYQLAAGFSLPVHRRWLLGAKGAYQVQLTAKDIDPRNKNQWMEWQFTPGLGYLYRDVLFGASFLYIRRKETVNYQNMGSHTTFPVLAAYPLGYFKTLSVNENVNWYYASQEMGVSLQLGFNKGPFNFFQEVNGCVAGQTIESNRIQNRREGESDTWQINYKGNIQKKSPRFRHEWEWRVTFSHINNYDPLQHQVESKIWQSDGKLLRSTRRTSRYELTYRYDQLRGTGYPRFTILSGISYYQAESALLFYPAEFTQPVHRFTVHSKFVRCFLLPNALLDLSLGGQYGKGSGSILNEKQLQSGENAPEIPLWQNRDRLQQVFDYETMPRWGMNASITYTRSIPYYWFVCAGFHFERICHKVFCLNSQRIEACIGLLF